MLNMLALAILGLAILGLAIFGFEHVGLSDFGLSDFGLSDFYPTDIPFTRSPSPLLVAFGDCPFMPPPAVAAIPCHRRLRFHLAALLDRPPALLPHNPYAQLRSCVVSSSTAFP